MFTYKIIFDEINKSYSCKLTPTKKLYSSFSNKDYLENLERIVINQQLEKNLDIIFYKDNSKLMMSVYIQHKMRTDLKNEIINYIKSNNFGTLIKTDIDYMYGQNIYRFKITNSEILLSLI